jgi:hypothetical protein
MFLLGAYVTLPCSGAPPTTALQLDVFSAVNEICKSTSRPVFRNPSLNMKNLK